MDLEESRKEYESKKTRNDILEGISWLVFSATFFMGLGWVVGGFGVVT